MNNHVSIICFFHQKVTSRLWIHHDNPEYTLHFPRMGMSISNLAQRCATGKAEWRIIGKMAPQTCWWSWWLICGQPSTSPQFRDGYSCRYRTYQHAHAVFVQSNNQPLPNRSICHLHKYIYFLFRFVFIEQFVHYGIMVCEWCSISSSFFNCYPEIHPWL